MKAVAQRFDQAAPSYDKAASVQGQVADNLVAWAQPITPPRETLDIGSGTGFVTQAIRRRWPGTSSVALDISPSMLQEARRKLPALKIISGDAAQLDPCERFDAAFSSMALHWLPQPAKVLRRWQSWLKHEGRLYVALLIEGSFGEWRDLCHTAGLRDGLWPMPRADFADHLASRTKREVISVSYPSAEEFLNRLKAAGASAPRPGYVPLDIPKMRHLIAAAPRPFAVSYAVLYIELPISLSI